MSKRKKTWWTIKAIDHEGTEHQGDTAFKWRGGAEKLAEEYRGYGWENVRVVPCDPPKLRHSIKAK